MNYSIGAGIAIQLVLGLLFLRELAVNGSIQHTLLLLGAMIITYFITLTLASIRRYHQQDSDAESENP